MKQIFNYILISVLFVSCSNNKNEFDASGTFEAIETIIPAQANGILTQFSVS
jgi:HlyD family secretion protein